MIRVLVMGNESVLAKFIESSLARETDVEVFRATRDELGTHRDYSIVIVVDEEIDGDETMKLQEIVGGENALLLVRVSLKSRHVQVEESYQIANPGIDQLVSLFREFNRKTQKGISARVSGSQKKMNDLQRIHTSEYDRQQTVSAFDRLFATSQAADFRHHLLEQKAASSHREIPMVFYSFLIQYLRLKNRRNVTLPIWQAGITEGPGST